MSTTTTPHHDGPRAQRRSVRLAAPTMSLGGLLFLVGTALHPARHGDGVAAVGDVYGFTHGVQAIGLATLVVALASILAMIGRTPERRVGGWYAALVGTVAWFGLIVYDGAVNPVIASYEPELVHAGGQLDPMGTIIVLPALLLFPLGYVLLARSLARTRQRTAGVLLGTGAVLYTLGGFLIFGAGPESGLIQPLEVIGTVAFALGAVLLARAIRVGGHAALEVR